MTGATSFTLMQIWIYRKSTENVLNKFMTERQLKEIFEIFIEQITRILLIKVHGIRDPEFSSSSLLIRITTGFRTHPSPLREDVTLEEGG